MPTNKHAAFRYRVLDACFRRRGRRWTKDELLQELCEQLRDAFGSHLSVGRRTLEADIALMRSEPPRGFRAPIVVRHGEYFYEDPGFSIERLPLSAQESALLREAFALLRQFPGLPQWPVLESLLAKTGGELPDTAILQFEINEQVAGLQWLAPLYDATRRRQALHIRYQPFTAPETEVLLHPYLLKEWRNRWYIIGLNAAEAQIWNLALDRIQAVLPAGVPFRETGNFDPNDWFRDIVGVTRLAGEPVDIRFRAAPAIAGYFLTKPLHPSQQLLQEDPTGLTFTLRVIPNFELLGDLLRFGNEVEVLEPAAVREAWVEKLKGPS